MNSMRGKLAILMIVIQSFNARLQSSNARVRDPPSGPGTIQASGDLYLIFRHEEVNGSIEQVRPAAA